jgi:hypothetical protein
MADTKSRSASVLIHIHFWPFPKHRFSLTVLHHDQFPRPSDALARQSDPGSCPCRTFASVTHRTAFVGRSKENGFENKETEVVSTSLLYEVTCARLSRTEVTYESDEEPVHEEVAGYDVGH